MQCSTRPQKLPPRTGVAGLGGQFITSYATLTQHKACHMPLSSTRKAKADINIGTVPTADALWLSYGEIASLFPCRLQTRQAPGGFFLSLKISRPKQTSRLPLPFSVCHL